MYYWESRLESEGDNARLIKNTLTAQIELFEKDVEELIVPVTLMSPSEFTLYVHNIQILGNIERRLRHNVMVKLDVFTTERDTIQQAIGGAAYLKNDTTGKPIAEVQRKALASFATKVWGPVEIVRKVVDESTMEVTHEMILSKGAQGIKEGVLPAVRMTAMQLREFITPALADEEVPSVKMSYDDLCRQGELLLKQMDAIENELKSRHFILGNITKLIEVENFEARRASREGI